MPPVRCADCGFLAVVHAETDELLEVPEAVRKTWAIPPSATRPQYKRYCDMPVCFARACDLAGDVGVFSPQRVLAVIERERECGAFHAHKVGQSPKELESMITLERIQQEADARRAADDAIQAEQRRQEKEIAEIREKQKEDREDRKWKWDVGLKLFVPILSVVVGSAGTLFVQWVSRPAPPTQQQAPVTSPITTPATK